MNESHIKLYDLTKLLENLMVIAWLIIVAIVESIIFNLCFIDDLL